MFGRKQDTRDYGGRNFQCRDCGARRRDSRALDEHMKDVHGRGRTYPCPVCRRNLPNHTQLVTHAHNAHGRKV